MVFASVFQSVKCTACLALENSRLNIYDSDLQVLAESCMASSPRARPTFSGILEALSTLLQALEAGDVEPHEAFAVYQDWGACDGPVLSMSPEL